MCGTLNEVFLGFVNMFMNFPREESILHDMVRYATKASLGQGCSASHVKIVGFHSTNLELMLSRRN